MVKMLGSLTEHFYYHGVLSYTRYHTCSAILSVQSKRSPPGIVIILFWPFLIEESVCEEQWL